MKASSLFLAAAKPTRPTRPGKPAGMCFRKEQKYYIYFNILNFGIIGVKLWIVDISFKYFLKLVSQFYFVLQPLVAQEQFTRSVPPHEVKMSAQTATHREDAAT